MNNNQENKFSHSPNITPQNGSYNVGSTPQQSGLTPVLQSIQDGSFISSERNKVNDLINTINQTTNEGILSATEARKRLDEVANTQYNYDKRIADRNIDSARTAFAQSQQMGTSVAQAKVMQENINSTIATLNKQHEEALARNAVQEAQQIANLKLQNVKLLTDVNARLANEVLNVGQVELQIRKQYQSEQAFEFQKQAKLGELASRYGVPVNPGDTILDVINRVAPFAGEEEKNKLDAQRKEIEKADTYVKKILADMANDKARTNAYVTNMRASTAKLRSDKKGIELNMDYVKTAIDNDPKMAQLFAQMALTGKVANSDKLFGVLTNYEKAGLKSQAYQDMFNYIQDGDMDTQDIINTMLEKHPTLTPIEAYEVYSKAEQEYNKIQENSFVNKFGNFVADYTYSPENYIENPYLRSATEATLMSINPMFGAVKVGGEISKKIADSEINNSK